MVGTPEIGFSNPNKANKFVYDPQNITVISDCNIKPFTTQCFLAWCEQRTDDIACTPRKLLRLAFHDCVPYLDDSGNIQGGGCDGCLNLDENLKNNNGLQYPVATLERLFTDKSFPKNAPKLKKSLKKIGVSRADLWAFASLVALDEVLKTTKSRCRAGWVKETMCGYPCDHKITDDVLTMFKTGREDCKPKDGASNNHKYLTGR